MTSTRPTIGDILDRNPGWDDDPAAWRETVSDNDLKRLHSLFVMGTRPPAVALGEREYQRRRSVRRRAESADPPRRAATPMAHHAPCASCQRSVRISGRGLCDACYKREAKAGTLDRWPSARSTRRVADVIEDADELWSWGEIPERIAQRTGVKVETIEGYYRGVGRRAPWVGREVAA